MKPAVKRPSKRSARGARGTRGGRGTRSSQLAVGTFLISSVVSPSSHAAPSAAEVEKRVDTILKQMTLEEKIDYIGGDRSFYVRAVPRLGLPAIRMADGPLGVRNYGPATTFAGGIALAAAWDTELAARVGEMIGRDARARGVHIMLGPAVNIYRAPMCGRNFEYMGEDPFLASRIAVSYIKGMQAQGVSATIKHFMANNSEVDRHGTSSDIDERTMRELYMPAFETAVKEGQVGAIMNSYNLVNGVHATQSDFLNNQVAKREWGFDGVMMSDWDATYDAVAAANAGLDLEMPSGKLMNRATLLPAIKEGKVSVATVDDKVRRILRLAVRFGWLDHQQADDGWPRYSAGARKLALDSARESLVLLKNQGDLLPLDRGKLKSIAIIGPNAHPAVPVGGGSAQVRPFAAVSFLQGLVDYLGDGVQVHYSHGVATLAEIFDETAFVTAPPGQPDSQPGLTGEYFKEPSLAGAPALTRVDEHIDFAWDRPVVWPTGPTKASAARWSGYFVPAGSGEHRFAAFTYGLDEYRVFVDGKLLFERAGQPQPIIFKSMALKAGKAYAIRLEYVHRDHHARLGFGIRKADQLIAADARATAARADVAIVIAGFDTTTEAEGYDRTFQLPAGQDDLIDVVTRANRKTVVALTSGGGVDMTRWLERTPAVLETWYPGQEGGRALAEVLFGAVNPSGKLPVSFERRWEDSAAAGSYYPDAKKRIAYREGIFLGYRHFDQKGKKPPLFPFGHGLSYTKFKYANLTVTPDAVAGDAQVTVAFDVTNTGAREGAEVAQVYVADGHAPVARPPKELKGFARLPLGPGETRRAEVKLDRRAFAYFDPKAKAWKAAPGAFQILVGPSSRQIALEGKVTLRD